MIITKNDEHICDNDIAIVGMSGRFPCAEDIHEFWENLIQGKECVKFFSEEELRTAGVSEQLLQNRFYVKAGVVLDNIEMFDADFFGYTPKEAALMDPQQRLFLEVAWEALENAGYDAQHYPGLIGVYAGTGFNHYLVRNIMMSEERDSYTNNMQIIVENDKDFLVTRVNHKLNLRGPGVSVQTACSSSLVAIHIACQSILDGECDMALAGGVSIKLPMTAGYVYQPGGILSTDGHCRTFDNEASGTIFGSGAGAIVLKNLKNAIEDNDTIYAVIKGSAINNDGATKVSYTAPSIEGQAGVIVEAIANSGVDIHDISYIETHGTGTSLGDPIELSALNKAFDIFTNRKHFCALGSSKPNTGHLDAASGVTGVIKTVLALNNEMIPPNINYSIPNKSFHLANSPFIVNDHAVEWISDDKTRCAGVSSFGVGGTNAHLILEEVSDQRYRREERKRREWQVAIISAKTDAALMDYCKKYIAFFKESNDELQDICYTMAIGRTQFQKRRVLIGKDKQSLIEQLTDITNQNINGVYQAKWKNLNFIFDDSLCDTVILESNFHSEESLFTDVFNECEDYILEIIEENPSHNDTDNRDNDRIKKNLKKLVIQCAIAKTLIEFNVVPQKITGIGTGILAGLAVADVISIKDALTLVCLLDKKNRYEYNNVLSKIRFHRQNMQRIIVQTLHEGRIVCDIRKEYIEYDKMTLNRTKDDNHDIPLEEMNLFFNGDGADICNDSQYISHMFYRTSGQSVDELLLHMIGKLWSMGADVDWKRYYMGLTTYRVAVPTYPFQRKPYWIDPSLSSLDTGVNNGGSDTLSKTTCSDVIQEELMLDQYEILCASIERIIASIWMDAMGVDHLSMDDNFFVLGGNSLLATNMVYQLEMIFSVNLSLETFFTNPTVKELADYIMSHYEEKESLRIITSTYLDVMDND